MVYAGVGNTVCRQFGRTERRLVSKDGTLGQIMSQPLVQRITLSYGDSVVMHTDGVRSTIDTRAVTGVLRDEPPGAARKIVQQFGKPTDDAGCLVIKFVQ
jgi:serine/threonine protein phosphatase PrpC